jgi:hypothetical protein
MVGVCASCIHVIMVGGMAQWPAVSSVEVVPDNAEMRLFGGAAFERVVQEFQIAASLAAVHAGQDLPIVQPSQFSTQRKPLATHSPSDTQSQ